MFSKNQNVKKFEKLKFSAKSRSETKEIDKKSNLRDKEDKEERDKVLQERRPCNDVIFFFGSTK